MMGRLFSLKPGWAFGIFIFLDILCVAMGMGVPIFCILFGFLVGWYITRMVTVSTEPVRDVLGKILVYAVVTSVVTFALMALIWGRTTVLLFDPATDYANFGMPMILYDPKLSFVGWQILMIVISPFLQLLTTIFGAYLTLLIWLRADTGGSNDG